MKFPPGTQPFRTPEQRACAERLYGRMVTILRTLKSQTLELVRSGGKAPDGLVWGPQETYWLDRYVADYLAAAIGEQAAREASRYADPANAGILPEEAGLAYRTGVGQGAVLAQRPVAEMEAAIGRNLEGFQRTRFAQLSERGWGCLREVIDRENPPGVKQIIAAGMQNGTNSAQVGRELAKTFDEYEKWEFVRLARTETAFALNAATTAELQAQGYVEIPGVEYPPIHPNCFPAGTEVVAPGVQAALRTFYSGELVEIGLADGRRLSVTVNHPILTPVGLAPAGSLREGDYVVCCGGLDGVREWNPDVHGKPSTIDEVFVALVEAGGVTATGVPVSAEDLHGDAALVDGYIDVVLSDGKLLGDMKPAVGQHGDEFGFERADAKHEALSGLCALAKAIGRPGGTSHCGVCGRDLSHAALRGGTRILGDFGLALTSESDTGGRKQAVNGGTCEADVLGDAIRALAGQVSLDKVVGVSRKWFSGHVYDLQTFASLYIANGVVASNCRCSESIDPETGYITLSVAATACIICQEARIASEAALAAAGSGFGSAGSGAVADESGLPVE